MLMTSSFDNLSLLRKSNSVDSTVETSIGSAGTEIELDSGVSHNESKTIAKWNDKQTKLFEEIIKKKEYWTDDDWKA